VTVADQPTGTVTLVFTDIEGSTRLLDELGQDEYRDALARHREIVRAAFAAGYEVDY
jgi:class 3 adenylate cyclase